MSRSNLVVSRNAWWLLALSALALELSALWFQYGMQLDPCVMCVYERLAVIGLFGAGLIGALRPPSRVLRWLGYAAWAISAGWGVLLAVEHVGLQNDPSAAMRCSFLPDFPLWLPLHEWLPALFLPTGYCDEIQWQFLSLSMAEWMVVIFAGYLLTLLWVLGLEVRYLRSR